MNENTWFTRQSDISQRTTRASSTPFALVEKRYTGEVRKHFFSLRAAREWNKLPIPIREVKSVTSFKEMYDDWMKNSD